MKILVSGAGGLVGTALTPRLLAAGHDVRALSRSGSTGEGIGWDVRTGALDRTALNHWGSPEAIVHLAGENIAARRWTSKQKGRIRDSRVIATERLAENLVPLAGSLRVFVGASAIGFYGDRGDEILTESSARGTGFLAEIAERWESAANPLIAAGVRVVHLRFGVILSRDGGALPQMLPIFRLGLGGRISSGQQWMSWISIGDVVRAIEYALTTESAAGPYNAVAPHPVRNAEFTKTLGAAIRRPAFLPVPAFAVRLVLGEMGEAILLSSQRVLPERWQAAGFRFEQPELSGALRQVLYKI